MGMQLDKLLNEDPNDPIPNLFLGEFYFSINDLNNSSAYYIKAHDLDNSTAAAYEGLGNTYFEQHNTDSAIAMYEAALNLSPRNTIYLNNLADIHYERKNYPKASDLYEKTLSLNPYFLAPYCGCANSLRIQGHLGGALRKQEKLIRLFDDNNITNIRINNLPWLLLNKSGETISLDSGMKKCYIYYNTALTYSLLEKETKTREYLKKANDLNIGEDSTISVKSILDLDIENFQDKQHNHTNHIINFRNVLSQAENKTSKARM